MRLPANRLTGLFSLTHRTGLLAVSCIVLFLCSIVHVQAQSESPGWTKVNAGTMAWLHSVFFLDHNRGWVVGSKGTVLATRDGGATWVQKTSVTTDVLRDMYFVDEQNGWLLCEKNIYDLKEKDDPRTYLMQTTDGGEHWTRIDIKGIEVELRLLRVVFASEGRGWVFGEYGAIFATRDAGASWTRLQSPTRHLLLGGIFVDDDRGWLVGAGATIIQTADGGNTWHQTRLTEAIQKAIRFSATSFVDNRQGWAVGSGGTIYRTVNGGRTWEVQNSGVAVDLFDVKFLDPMEGWAVGAEGTIIYTNDGGLHWSSQRSGTVHPLERIFFADRTRAWAVGFGGTVVTYVRKEAPGLLRKNSTQRALGGKSNANP